MQTTNQKEVITIENKIQMRNEAGKMVWVSAEKCADLYRAYILKQIEKGEEVGYFETWLLDPK